ncbi:MAG: aminotransferase class III-fold pyridoxal phosphate-dependent enzyme [Gammaproteobacteria bacterium]|nr:aminotransferase class III-fold pyridoxal phosphate-dependent enzyme [Gammaproteobacteria bacterium]
MAGAAMDPAASDPRTREAATTLPVYGQLPFVPERAAGCDIITSDGRRILDLYGGHAVASLGYGHQRLTDAISKQSARLIFQSNAVALEVRARAAEKLVAIAPRELSRVFFVNSGAEANENALRMACVVTHRKKVLAITQGFHGRTAAAGAVTWNSRKWYGFPEKPFDVDFIPRDDCAAAKAMIDNDIAAVIVEPVQGVAGAYDLSHEFLTELRDCTRRHGVLLIADEVQSGMGRCGQYFAVQAHEISPDILTSAKALGGGIPCGAVLCTEDIAPHFGPGDLGTTFGGGPVAAAAINAVIESIDADGLLKNVREREAQIREQCRIGPVQKIQGMGLLLGLVCDRPAVEVRNALLEHDILTGTSADPDVLRILAPLVLEARHVDYLAHALESMAPTVNQERPR